MGANCALWTGDIKLQLVSKRRNQKQLHCCIRKTKVSRQHVVRKFYAPAADLPTALRRTYLRRAFVL
jgi:hypothetical protein